MFSRSELGTATSKSSPPSQSRVIGAIVLIICIVALLILALGADAAIFIPLNATEAVTLTWQAAHGDQATSTPRPRFRITPAPHNGNPGDQSV